MAPAHPNAIPKPALWGALMMILLTFTSAGAVKYFGFGKGDGQNMAVNARDLWFEDRENGAVAVMDGADHHLVSMIEPGTNGFLRSVLRGLVKERRREDFTGPVTFRVTQWADGQLTIEDRDTHRVIELRAFGPTNSGAFSRLLSDSEAAR